MRTFKDNTGAVFDVPGEDAERYEDIFENEQTRATDFKIQRATDLPELKEDFTT